MAERHLRRAGYRVLGRNLSNQFGEIDLLVEGPDHTVVVVEVKTGTIGQSPPQWRVNRRKQQRLEALAVQFARRYRLTDRRIRFDVVAVQLPPDGEPGEPVIRHLPNAFEARW